MEFIFLTSFFVVTPLGGCFVPFLERRCTEHDLDHDDGVTKGGPIPDLLPRSPNTADSADSVVRPDSPFK